MDEKRFDVCYFIYVQRQATYRCVIVAGGGTTTTTDTAARMFAVRSVA